VKQFAVYILASGRNGTLYVGLTSNLVKRVWEHKEKAVPSFTARHDCDKLVYFELYEDGEAAMVRERQLKEWRRAWKIALIEKSNPQWVDLYPGITR
jgi:putative endonuclease